MFGGAKLLRELFRRQIAMKIGAAPVIHLLEQGGELVLVAQRQPDG
jgi:hypothetical protein